MDLPFNLILEAFSSKKKNTIIFNVQQAINISDAWISDFNSHSEKMISFSIECNHSRLRDLFNNLQNSGINFYDFSTEQIRLLDSGKVKGDMLISLIISFIDGPMGDMGTRVDGIEN